MNANTPEAIPKTGEEIEAMRRLDSVERQRALAAQWREMGQTSQRYALFIRYHGREYYSDKYHADGEEKDTGIRVIPLPDGEEKDSMLARWPKQDSDGHLVYRYEVTDTWSLDNDVRYLDGDGKKPEPTTETLLREVTSDE